MHWSPKNLIPRHFRRTILQRCFNATTPIKRRSRFYVRVPNIAAVQQSQQSNLKMCIPRHCGLTALIVIFMFIPGIVTAQYVPSAGKWEYREPAKAGLDAATLQTAVEFAQANESQNPRDLLRTHYRSFAREPFGEAIGPFKTRGPQSGVIVKDGYIVAEWSEPERVDMTFSVRKSFLSTVVGLPHWKPGCSSSRKTERQKLNGARLHRQEDCFWLFSNSMNVPSSKHTR